jgi:elongation factor Ts
MTTTIEWIKQVREETRVGIQVCRMALESANSSYAGALAILREKAAAEAARRSDRLAQQGRVEVHSHSNGRIAVMVEINCETDFVSRSEVFRNLAHELALQIAAEAPCYVRDEEIPAEVLEAERQKMIARGRAEGKTEPVLERMTAGALERFKKTAVLLRQPYIRNETITVGQLVSQASASTGEKIVVKRFARWEMGEPENDIR